MFPPRIQSLPRPFHPLLTVLIILASLATHPGSARSQDLIPPKTTIRQFPQGFFCPIPIRLRFTADAAQATLHFSANPYCDNSGEALYTFQAIDNIIIVKAADFVPPNMDAISSDYSTCYAGAPVDSILYFDRPGLSFPFVDLFDLGPAVGWDLANGAYFDNSRSADRDPSNPGIHNATGGSLGLGNAVPTPVLADTGIVARTSITVSGLAAGHDFYLIGWWDVGAGVFTDLVRLTIEITGMHNTPIAHETWGALKSRYR